MLVAITAASAWVSLCQIDRTARHWTEWAIDFSYSSYLVLSSPGAIKRYKMIWALIKGTIVIMGMIIVAFATLFKEWMQAIDAFIEDCQAVPAIEPIVPVMIAASTEAGTQGDPIESLQSNKTNTNDSRVLSVVKVVDSTNQSNKISQNSIESYPNTARRTAKKRSNFTPKTLVPQLE